jgi:hypothetical protein
MRKLRVYGDSFSASDGEFPGWVDLLKKQLDIPLVNKSVSGSSTEYSIRHFVNDITDKQIGDNDIVIFVLSTPGRVHFEYQNTHPDTGSAYLHIPDKSEKWYWENQSHILWYLTNQDLLVTSINHEAYIHLIKSYAYTKPNCTFVLLSNSNHGTTVQGVDNPNNFLRCDAYLNQISSKEIVGGKSYQEWVKNTKWDLRINHLTIPNLNTLANLIFDAILTKNITNITYDKFNTNCVDVIETKQQYLDYVANGLLYPMYSIGWWSSKTPNLK